MQCSELPDGGPILRRDDGRAPSAGENDPNRLERPEPRDPAGEQARVIGGGGGEITAEHRDTNPTSNQSGTSRGRGRGGGRVHLGLA